MDENNTFEVKEIYRHIYVIENIMSDSECEFFIDYINSNDNKDTDDNIVRAFVRNLQNNNESDIIVNKKIHSLCNKLFRSIIKINPFVEINGDIFYHLRKIYGPTSLHTDEVPSTVNNFIDNKIRTIALIINLNDDYQGGEFHFPKQNVTHKMKRGSAILFPPFWTHPHEISDVSSYRYTITTWGTEKIITQS